ncbi:MAG: hypothetical protein KatS3mg127_1407 [Silanimonas sp.]|nr:MAG: hypothetical protein KatS3mg127_1407 [Silanimonas sp.]
MPMPAPPSPHLSAPPMALLPPAGHRITRAPRLGRRDGALWLGAGLCLATLLLLRGSDTPREERP